MILDPPHLWWIYLPWRMKHNIRGYSAHDSCHRFTLRNPPLPLRVGIGGPVGSGKTALVEKLCKRLRDTYDIYVITNDIYTKEDQLILTRAKSLPADRIMGVETGGCPHTAISRRCFDEPGSD